MACLILTAPAPWFHDFAEWLFQARMIGLKLTDPHSVAAYELASYPVPNSLAILLLAALTLFLPPLIAGKVYLLLQLTAWAWLLASYARRFAPPGSRGSVFLVSIAIVALSSFFWYGFISYQFGLWLLFLFLYQCNRPCPPWVTAAFGIALFLSHAMTALVWGLIVVGQAIDKARDCDTAFAASKDSRLVSGCLPLLPAVGLASWYLAARLFDNDHATTLDAGMSGLFEAMLYKAGYPLMLGSFRNILQANGAGVFEDWPVFYLVGAGANALLALLLACWAISVLWKALRRKKSPPDERGNPALAWAALALTTLYLIAPYGFLGLLNPAGRLLLPLIGIMLILAPASSFHWWRWAAWPAALGLILSLAGYGALVTTTTETDIGASVSFRPATGQLPDRSVFAFNQALYAGTRFPYFNYRVLVHGQRFGQLLAGDYSGLGFRTGPIVRYRAHSD
jgi:hypothetical protein